jgi:hypothetical protein
MDIANMAVRLSNRRGSVLDVVSDSVEMRAKRIAAVAVGISLWAQASWVWACPACKEAIAQNDPSVLGLAKAYNQSILLLMTTPYLLFAGLAAYIVHTVKKNRTKGH